MAGRTYLDSVTVLVLWGKDDMPPNHKLFLCKTIYLYSTLNRCDRLWLYLYYIYTLHVLYRE